MDFLDCISSRRSIRQFSNLPVSRETIQEIVKAASFSPSWKNSQTVRYTVIDDPAVKAAVAEHIVPIFPNNARIINNAPALVVLSSIRYRCGYERDGSFSTTKGDSWEMFDAGIAAQTFCLAAHNAGLGTVIMGIFDENTVASHIHLPDNQRVSALIAIGHPAETPGMPKRKDVTELLQFI